MVFVHVSRCLIFKVHWPYSLIEISVVSSVALNRGDYYIVAHRKANVKNFFLLFRNFFLNSARKRPCFPQRARIY